MRKIYFLAFFVLCGINAGAQCLTNSLIINTGYDPISGTAITAGTDGGTAVPDPHWIITAESPSIATAIFSTGLTEVTPGSSADIVTTEGSWASNPGTNPGGWLSCINSNTYTTDGTGPTGTPYNMTFGRPFTMCSADSIKLDFYIANDNYISATDIDGVPLGFSQPAGAVAGYFTAFTHFTQTVYLTAGTHTIHVVVNNYNDDFTESNPTGLDIYGTVSSTSGATSLITENYASCISYACSYDCNAVTLPDTLHPCKFTSIVLPAVMTGTDSLLSITWSPATGLSYDTVLDPTLTVGGSSGWYDITLRSLMPFNLVVNGDFSAGNTGFTSSYTYAGTGSSALVPEGVYTVTTDPHLEHSGAVSFGDHTTGTGEMMAINGAGTPISVWCETIPVLPNTDYNFSAWIANWSSADVGTGDPILQFMINGVLIGTPTTITSAPGVWVNFFTTWNSGTNTVATICIYDENTAAGGNDFALDDISFEQICTVKDSVYIDILIPDTTTAKVMDTTLCISLAPLTLNSLPGYVSYLWSTGSTATSIAAGATGTYWVQNIANCNVLVDSFTINYIPLPVVNLGNDTAFCIGNTITLSSIQPSGYTYLWSDGSTGDSMHVSTTGTYWLQVYDGCTVTDSIHVLVSPFPVVNLGPDQFNCVGEAVTLESSVTYTSPTYLWSTGSTASSITVPLSGTYWEQVTVGGCPSADTINVTIIYDTVNLFNRDTAICLGMPVQALVTANPAATFQWLPTAGIADATVASPLIVPDTSAMYYVNVLVPGCPVRIDSFYIDVQPVPSVSIGVDRFVCSYDTLHISATVTPGWYGNYSYNWSPATDLDNATAQSVVYRAGSTGELHVTVNTPAGCKAEDSINVTVQATGFAHLDSIYNVCPHDSVQLLPVGGVTYHWSPGLYLSDSMSAVPWLKPITSQEYRLIAISAYGCMDTLWANVFVRPNAVINVGDSVTLYPGQSYQISPQTNCVTFAWFPPEGLSDAHISNPVATPVISTNYIVKAANEWGCVTEDSLVINIDGSSLLTLPNAFTPGTGPDNVLYIIKRGIASLHYFRIYNRWGNKVFETDNINTGWDGSFKGSPQPYDVYVYEIEAVTASGTVFHKQGNVTLIR
jgi:gliding motility-associated-like protein